MNTSKTGYTEHMSLYRKLRALLHPYRVQWMKARHKRAVKRAETRRVKIVGVWLDVGAHEGETTIDHADKNPDLTVYAFEPTLETAIALMKKAPTNYHVFSFAVSEVDGPVTFHINGHDATHSLFPLRPEGVAEWTIDTTQVEREQRFVPSLRLDTFLREAAIPHVDYLKIDTQGADLGVVKSAGEMLSCIDKIRLEVITAPEPLYAGQCTKPEVLAYLTTRGFRLVETTVHESGLFEDLVFVRA